jgi:hypothetical protein
MQAIRSAYASHKVHSQRPLCGTNTSPSKNMTGQKLEESGSESLGKDSTQLVTVTDSAAYASYTFKAKYVTYTSAPKPLHTHLQQVIQYSQTFIHIQNFITGKRVYSELNL